MSLSAAPISRYARIVALVALAHGLIDGARILMGSGSGPQLAQNHEAFWTLASFVVIRLIAAVGLWNYAVWGAMLVALANLGEIMFALLRPELVGIGIFGLVLRLLMLSAAILLLAFERHLRRLSADEV
ncbi:hypothetical protein [Cucumibacter marinus]|uniref:hypothetical protein n=1 Tax=Cucumibacter marinus TaxID=1121252 RepID=UPI0004222DBF|nr:hypothetical protein [Cucumibacter marinus]